MRLATVAFGAVGATLLAIILAVRVNFWLGLAVLVATIVVGVGVTRLLVRRPRR